MKRIYLSLIIIGIVVGFAFSATNSFFSDTETSLDNTFFAGALDLKIDNESYYNGELWEGTTWQTLADLDDGQGPAEGGAYLFFDFTDVKPDDEGEDTISLHVENDAWACMSITKTADDDVTCTTPELADDPNCAEPGEGLGELGVLLEFAFWADDGDNVLEEGEEVFKQGAAASLFDGAIWTLADSQSNIWNENQESGPMLADQEYFIGKAWCFGELTLDPVGAGQGVNPTVDPGVDCDGTQLDNASQTDKFMADIVFTAEQARHNDEFLCSPPPDPGEPYVDAVTSLSGTFGNCCDANNLSSDQSVAESKITGAPDSPPDSDFIQLSDNTVLTAKFVNNKAIDGPGADIRVHIYDALFPASAQIEIGQGPDCGTTSYQLAGTFADTSDVDIDLASLTVPLTEAQCIQFTDIVEVGDPFPTLGFDLDAIEALNSQAIP